MTTKLLDAFLETCMTTCSYCAPAHLCGPHYGQAIIMAFRLWF